MKGNRAGIVTALLARAPAAQVGFRPMQILIWQIEGGLSYSEMPAQSKQLIDRLVPDYKNELRADFFNQLQGKCGKLSQIFPGISGLCGPVNALEQDYQRIHQVLMQDENNYQALAHQFVHVIPGKAPYVGPTYWSRLNSRVYERLVGGAVYGETAKLEVKVLPSSAVRLSVGRGRFKNVAYIPNRGQSAGSNTATGTADVPVCSTIAYPNQTASQVLGCSAEGGPTVQLDTPVVNGLSVTVNGVATPGTSGASIKQIAWNWGDGTTVPSGSFPQTHTYAQPGNYTVAVMAMDTHGAKGPAQTSVRVQGVNPTITSVSTILPLETQTITITGSGFGSVAPFDGDSAYIQVGDITRKWYAGHSGNWVTLSVQSWTDSQIVLDGFTGRYGMAGTSWTLQPGDQVQVKVWDAQGAAGPATYSLSVAGAVAQEARLVLRLEILNFQLKQIQTDLMWIDCAPRNVNQVTADFVQAMTDQTTGQMVQTGEFMSEVALALKDGNPVEMADTVLVPALMQEAGFSCNSYSVAKVIIRAAQSYAASHPLSAQPSPFTSRSITPTSLPLQYAPGTITFTLPSGSGRNAETFRLTFVPCSQDSSCSASQKPDASAPTKRTPQGQASASSAIGINVSVNATALPVGGTAEISGIVRDLSGGGAAGVRVKLTASEGSAFVSSAVTTNADGSFKLNFTAPQKPGVVTITARIVGMPNSPVATTKLQVLPKR